VTIKELQKRRAVALVCSMVLLGVLTGMLWMLFGEKERAVRYDKEWMMGKTAGQIRERYGEFDQTTTRTEADGIYLNKARYALNPKIYGHFGQEGWLEIRFDNEGKVKDVWERFGDEEK